MRNLSSIIEAARKNEVATNDELRYALVALASLFHFDHRALREELTKEKRTPEAFRTIKAEDSFNRYKKALDKSPKEWLGWENDPKNQDYQERIKQAERIFEKFEKGGNAQ